MFNMERHCPVPVNEIFGGICSNVLESSRLHTVISVVQRSLEHFQQI